VGRGLRCGACLRAEVADLKRRIRMARYILRLFEPHHAAPKLTTLLDLRRPLKRGGK
jgi:hypothetical protein